MPSDTERKRRRKREAVRGVLLFAGLRLAAVVILLWCAAQTPELPWLQVLLAVVSLGIALPILFVGVTLKQRFQEIDGGEQDAAAQY